MLRDDGYHGGPRRVSGRNVLGEPLEICSIKPMTGFYRDGCCNTGREDIGRQTHRRAGRDAASDCRQSQKGGDGKADASS